MTGKLIAILVIVGIGWYYQNNYDFSGFKEETLETFKKEKTINAVNSRRDKRQQAVYDVLNK